MIPTTFIALLALSVIPFVVSGRTSTGQSDPIHIPITRRSNKARGLHDLAEAADHLRAKYNYRPVWPRRKRTGNTAAVPITNQDGDTSYVGSISVGTPAQQFNVLLDSGSSDLWLASTQCFQCPSGTPEYDSTKSSSFTTSNTSGPVSIRYGSGAVQGVLVQDTVSMAGFTVASQAFLSVKATTNGIFDGTAAGFMGLAFRSIASTGALPFWQALVDNNQFALPQMSFWLTRFLNNAGVQAAEPGGVLTLGGSNTTLYTGDIQFLDMPSDVTPSYWLLAISNMTVQGKSVKIATGDAAISAIDTGTTLIAGPSNDVRTIWAAVPGSKAMIGNMRGFYSFPCSTQVQVSISFGGNSWPINPVDMNLGTTSGGTTSGSGECVGSIFDLGQALGAGGGRGNPKWIVGDTFLKNVYTVFRSSPPSVGFAQLSAAAGGLSGVKDSSSSSASSSLLPAPSTLTSISASLVTVVTITGTPGSAATRAPGSNPSATGTGNSSSSGAPSLHTAGIGAISSLFLVLAAGAFGLC